MEDLYEFDEDSLEEIALDEKRKKRKKRKKKKKKAKRDACYHKVRARYDVWPSAYASGALVKCRKVGAANWGNKSKKKESIEFDDHLLQIIEEEYQAVLAEKKKLTAKPSSESSLKDWFGRIDAPETRTRDLEEKAAGYRTKERLSELLEASEGQFVIESQGVGKYGRCLGVIWIGDRNINDLLLQEGLAEVYK